MTAPQCVRCHRPSPDNAYLCRRCGDELAKAIGDVVAVAGALQPRHTGLDDKGHVIELPWEPGEHGSRSTMPWERPTGLSGGLADDLAVSQARQGRTSNGGGSRSAQQPLPWSEKARDASIVLTRVLTSWAATIVRLRGVSGPDDERPAVVAAWLLHHVDWIRHHDQAAVAYADIVDAVEQAQRVIDRRADRWYAGPCGEPLDDDSGDCKAELYAKPGAPTVTCPGCGAQYDVGARRQWLLAAAEDQWAYATLIARAITALGQHVTPARIWKWNERNRIRVRSVDQRGRPLYRIGDVLDLLAEEARTQAEKTQRATRRTARRAG